MFVMGSVEDDLALARMNKVTHRNKKNSEEEKLQSKKKPGMATYSIVL